MSEMIERMARAMYWQRVNPNRRAVTLSIAVREWSDLADEHWSGLQVWHCKAFWRHAARAAIDAMREPTDAMLSAPITADCFVNGVYPTGEEAVGIWTAMIEAALKETETA